MLKPVRYLSQRQEQGEEIQRRLKYGIPEIGWRGDNHLSLYLNKITNEWEVWDELNDRPHLVARKPVDGKLDIHSLCSHLRDHDFRVQSIDDIVARMDRKNDQLEKDRDAVQFDQMAEAMDKVYWGINKDVGHHY